MKVNSITIENIKSFKEKETISLNDGLNIFIGPNGGGKSNFIDILTNTLYTLVRHYKLDRSNNSPEQMDMKSVQLQNSNTNIFEKHYEAKDAEQNLSLTVEITAQDIEIIKQCKQILETLKPIKAEYEKIILGYTEFINEFDSIITNLHSLKRNRKITIEFSVDSSLVIRPSSSAIDNDFIEFLSLIEKLRLVLDHYKKTNVDSTLKLIDNPVIFISPTRTFSFPKDVALNRNSQFDTYIQGSKNQSSQRAQTISQINSIDYINPALYELAEVFLQNRWNPKTCKEDQLTTYEPFKRLNKYLDKFFRISFKLLSFEPPLRYRTEFTQIGRSEPIDINAFSSGEKQIIYFIFALLLNEVKDCTILIDEPELHLHKRFQSFLLEIFEDLASQYGNQIIFSSHSPSFITEETIANVFRIYKDENLSSKSVDIPKCARPTHKESLLIINSQNNERIFFSDKVILVEGIIDRLIFTKIINKIIQALDIKDVIEVVDVSSKNNLIKYRKFLDAFKVKNYIIADFDYVKDISSKNIKDLFVVNKREIDTKILKENCKDRDTLTECLELAIQDIAKNKDYLLKFVDYLKDRKVTLKEKLTKVEKRKLINFIAKKITQRVFILHQNGLKRRNKGDIESYLPIGYKDKNLDKILSLLDDSKFYTEFLIYDKKRNVSEIISHMAIILEISIGRARKALKQVS